MIVQCPYCKFVFEIKEEEVSISIGSNTPFVRCRNPKFYTSLGKKFYCDGFIDLSYAFGNNKSTGISANDDALQSNQRESRI